MTRHIRPAFFSALLVWAVAYAVLGLKLSIVGINLEVHNSSASTLIAIAVCSVLMFIRVLFNDQIDAVFKATSRGQLIPAKATNYLTLPSTQRWILLAMIVSAFVWPFFGSRGAVDIATLILIYV
ncbi:high-affinity branched-chain amino acid ABC transporter permease LivM, partial [Pseudomonas syringae pv. actinidifoliorum]|nr:high-affinity branched-chain amino acid ABC transporter permease LivM [Pseudomonas syringae pv. actinidifoliorum]